MGGFYTWQTMLSAHKIVAILACIYAVPVQSAAVISISSAAVAASSTGEPTTAAYFVSGTATEIARATLTATGNDESVIIVKDNGIAYLSDVTLIKTGNTTNDGDSSFTDLNAAVGIETNGTIYIRNSKILTDGESANGLHTYQDGSIAYLSDTTVDAQGDGSHGIYAAGGAIYGENLVVTTSGGQGSAIATDRGGGTIVVDKAIVNTAGLRSALVYSTGNITVSGLSGVSAVAPAGVIDGSNSFTLNEPKIAAGPEEHGVFQISSTVSTNGTTDTAYATVIGGSLSETRGDYGLLFVGNIQAYVYLTGVDITITSGILANISADYEWGDSGVNGGTAYLYLTDLDVTGDIYVDDISEINVYLHRANWKGALNPDASAGKATVCLDAESGWTLTGDSTVDAVTDQDSHLQNVHTGPYSLTYSS